MSDSDVFAIDVAIEAECSGGKIEQLAQGDQRIIVMAKALQLALAEIKAEIYECADERGISREQADAMWRIILSGMLGPKLRVQ